MELAIGELVAYGCHGAGRVVGREQRETGNARQEVILLELSEGMTVTLPLTLALESLRPLATEHQMASVQRTLRSAAPAGESVWLKRQKLTREKLALGEPIGLAEVVSDGNHRHQADSRRLSASDRQLYMKARRLLATEIGLLRGIPPAHADDWIANQLTYAQP